MHRRCFLAAGLASFATAAIPEEDSDEPSVPAPVHAKPLFNGKDTTAWVTEEGEPPAWKVQDGCLEVVPGAGSIVTREKFRDFQLHVEFRLPEPPDPGHGNSGVYLQNRYEVQILDSWGRQAETNGCGSLYRTVAPLRNVCKKPGRWQSFDIAFRAPRYSEAGELQEKGLLTVFHNRVLIHNNLSIPGKTGRAQRQTGDDPRTPGPILLQNHRSAVRFRNIWIVVL